MTPLPNQLSFLDQPPAFGGATYSPERDEARLSGALGRVYELMSDGEWRTLAEISEAVGCTEAGASARLRDFRKRSVREKYPNAGVVSECVERGLWRYRILK